MHYICHDIIRRWNYALYVSFNFFSCLSSVSHNTEFIHIRRFIKLYPTFKIQKVYLSTFAKWSYQLERPKFCMHTHAAKGLWEPCISVYYYKYTVSHSLKMTKWCQNPWRLCSSTKQKNPPVIFIILIWFKSQTCYVRN